MYSYDSFHECAHFVTVACYCVNFSTHILHCYNNSSIIACDSMPYTSVDYVLTVSFVCECTL